MRLRLAIATACLALAGCATAADSKPEARGAAKYADDPRLGEKIDKLCFTSNIDSFGNNTRDTFTVREGRDYYLIEVFGSCMNLEHAMTIRLPTSSICLHPGEHVIVSDSITGGGSTPFSTQRCMVNAIYKWDPKAKEKADADKADDEEKTDDTSETTEEES